MNPQETIKISFKNYQIHQMPEKGLNILTEMYKKLQR